MANGENTTKIIQVPLEKLMAHPKQTEIYGEIVPEDSFIQSIKERGVLQPLLICDINLFASKVDTTGFEYGVVAGHRRLMSGEYAGLKTLPCVKKDYNSYDETEVDLLVSNLQRKKSKKMIVKEIAHYKQISCQQPKLLDIMLLHKIVLEQNIELGDATPQIESLTRESEKIGKLVGVSKDEVKRTSFVMEGKKLEEVLLANEFLPSEFLDSISEKWEDIKTDYLEEKTTLANAFHSVNDLIKEVQTEAKKVQLALKTKREKGKSEKAVEFKPAPQKITLGKLVLKQTGESHSLKGGNSMTVKGIKIYVLAGGIFMEKDGVFYDTNIFDLMHDLGTK